jgi:4'-phosphopantetheinyl transferase
MMWQSADLPAVLPGSEIHVWRLSLASKPSSLGIDRDWLSEDERRRAGLFRFQKDRESYGLCRGFLRLLLGRYLATDPRGLRFGKGEYGKPFLETREMEFSVSHSGEYGLFAFSLGRRVGVDIERIRSFDGMMDVSLRFFRPGEHESLCATPEERRAAAFFSCWTRKEAAVKALGGSIAILCEDVEVSVLPEGPADLLAMPVSGEDRACWRLMDVPAGPGYAGALCFEELSAPGGPAARRPPAVRLWEPRGRS